MVSESAEPEAARLEPVDSEAEPEVPIPRRGTSGAIPRRGTSGKILVAIVTLVLLLSAVYFYIPGPENSLTLALLGFVPREGDSEAQWMAMALEEVLTAELTANRRLEVLAGKWTAEIRRTAGPAGELDEDALARLRTQLAPALADIVVTGVWEAEDDELGLRLVLRHLDSGDEDLLHVAGPAGDLPAIARAAADEIEAHLGLRRFSAQAPSAAVDLVPANPIALELYAKGLVAWRAGDADAARVQLIAALNLEPEHPMLHLIYGEILAHLGYRQQAAAAGSETLARAPHLARIPRLEINARSHRLLGDVEAAVAALDELLTLDPSETGYRLLRAASQGFRANGAFREAWR